MTPTTSPQPGSTEAPVPRQPRPVSRRQSLYAATMLVPMAATLLLAGGKVALRHFGAPSLVEPAQAQQSVRLPTPNSLNAPAPVSTAPVAAAQPAAAPAPAAAAAPVAPGAATLTRPSSAVAVLLEQASYWRNQAQYDQAMESLKRALALDPRNPDALALSGQLYAERGNRPAAEAALARLRQASPSDPRIDKIDQALRVGPIPQEALTDARKLARDGRQTEAVDRYNRVFRGNPPPDALSVEYYQTLAGTEGGWEQARDGLARTVRANPQDLRAQLAYAQILTYREGARADGISRLAALSRNPAVAEQANQAWRQALGWLPENKSAVEPLTVYLQNHPNDTDLTTKLEAAKNPGGTAADPTAVDRIAGFEALNKGRLADASQSFQKAIAANPNDADATGGLGIIKLRQKNYAEAKSLLGHAIALDPEHKGRWQSALNAATNPNSGGGPSPAQGLINRGDYAGAERQLGHDLTTANDPTGILLQLADVQSRQGRLGEAETSYRQALARTPRSAPAMMGLAGVLQREGRVDEATNLLAQAQQVGGGAQAGQARALALREQAQAIQDPATQAGLYQAAVAADPSSPWLKLDLARSLVKMHRVGEARAIMAQAVAGRPSTDALRAGIIFANETNDPDAAQSLIAQLPANVRTPDMRVLQTQAVIQRDIASAVVLSPSMARSRLLALAAVPDPDGSRGAAIARALAKIGDRTAARDAILVAQSSTPGQNPGAKIAYAGAFLDIGDSGEAESMLGSIRPSTLSAQQRRDYAQLNAGLVVRTSDQLNQKGKPADAYDVLAPALQQTPDNPALNMALARLYQSNKNPREALAINEGLLRRDPSNVDARSAAVDAALATGDRTRADALVQEGLQLNPNDPKAWITAANFDKARGNNSRALRDLARARELRLQQLGYSDNGADAPRAAGVSLAPGAPANYTPGAVYSRFAPSQGPSQAQGWADGGDDAPAVPRPYALNGYGTGGVGQNAYTPPSAIPPNLYPEGATPPASSPASPPPAPLAPFTPGPVNAQGVAPTYQPPPASRAATPLVPTDNVPRGRVLDTRPTSLPVPAGGASGQSADSLNGSELSTLPAAGSAAPPVYQPQPVQPVQPVAAPQPVYQPPAYQPPAYQPPAYQPAAAPPPVYQAPPVYQPPAYQPPAYQPPAYQNPAYQTQAPAYSPYRGTAASYGQPAYAPPAYAPPAAQAGVPPNYLYAPQQQGYLPQYAPAQLPPPRVEPIRAPRYSTDTGPFGQPTSTIADNPNTGYYANPFRRSSDVGTPAMSDINQSPIRTAAAPDPLTQQIDQSIVALRDQVAPSAEGGFGFRTRSGDTGLDRLNEITVPLEATFSPGGYGTVKLAAIPTSLTSGNIGGDTTNLQRFGTSALGLQAPVAGSGLFTPSYIGAIPSDQHAAGVGLDLNYALNSFTADVGTTPIGFRINNIVGGAEYAPKITDNLTLRMTAERRAITDSILSYAGTIDQRSGLKWGGVVRNRGRVNAEFSSGKADFYIGGGYSAINGTHVEANTEIEGGAGMSYPVYKNDTQEVRVGVDLVYFGYNKNLRFFTLGQGGYFSPQSYYAALIPIIYRERVDADLSYEVGVAPGVQSYHENASPYYPRDPALQAQLVASQANATTTIPGVLTQYPSRSQSGFSGNAHALVDYRVAPNLHLGGRVDYEHAGNFDQASGVVYARYIFNGTSVQ